MSESNKWIRIADCRDIPLREGRALTVGNREIAIFNLGDRFLAVDNRCPHRGGPLADGIVCGATVVCPLHGWKIRLEIGKGENGHGAASCIDTVRTRVEDGIVLLEFAEERAAATEVQTSELSLICSRSGMEALSESPSAAEA
ncbi:MAG TPA: Rieske 2Fe-2S domain-containing protein [Candidatus Binatia bacterium]|nr:Rieske 2Fe-2S domain-containing protein [Candidatus Binatia bacterium]